MGFSREVSGNEVEPAPVAQDPSTQEAGAKDASSQDAAAQDADAQAEDEEVKRPAELWRIEGSLAAVRAEIAQLEWLDDAGLLARLVELERRWRAELDAMLPESVLSELHEFFDWVDDRPAGGSELRIGLAQLAGWLDGLISGLDVPIAEPAD